MKTQRYVVVYWSGNSVKVQPFSTKDTAAAFADERLRNMKDAKVLTYDAAVTSFAELQERVMRINQEYASK